MTSMLASMEHKPFYDSGAYFVPEMGVYGGWVAHEDSFAALCGRLHLSGRA